MEWKTTSTVLAGLQTFSEPQAWELVVEHFREPIVRYGSRLGLSRTDAQDAAQEALLAFAQAYRAGKYDRTKGHLKSWLFGIATNQLRNLRRRNAGRGVRPVADLGESRVLDGVEDEGADLQALWDEEWRRTVFERCLAQVQRELEPQTFDVFRRVVFEEQSVDAVAEELGIARTAVYNSKYRVSKRLAELAQEYEDA